MTDLPTLIRAVETATGADREIDAALGVHFGLVSPDDTHVVDGGSFRDRQLKVSACVPKLTASIDAVVALIRREMPGAEEGYGRMGDEFQAYVPVEQRSGGFIAYTAKKPTPALALLLAFLRAVKARQELPK